MKSDRKSDKKSGRKSGKKFSKQQMHESAESQTLQKKPSYLGLLNAIAVGEARNDRVLRVWRDATDNKALAKVLDVVAIRECEHAAAFTKRLCELGYGVRESATETHEANVRLAASTASDCEKFKALLGIDDSGSEEDPFGNLFADHSIDATTGALLGRYIAEERDSGRRLREAFKAVNRSEDPVLDDIAKRLDRLTQTLEEIKALRN